MFLVFIQTVCAAHSREEDLDVYNVNLNKIDSYRIIEKDNVLDLVLENNLSTKTNKSKDNISYLLPLSDGKSLRVYGEVGNVSAGKRFSKNGSIRLTANKLILEDGTEVNLSSVSPTYRAYHSPHASDAGLQLARKITTLALGSSPFTFGTSLGAAFLIGGTLSAKQNGIQDFVWGGFDSSGLSFVEKTLRKQPDLAIQEGANIPFRIIDDIKINEGIKKEKVESINLDESEARERIEQLIKWGDLSGALEISIKTGQEEYYEKIMQEISAVN